MVCTQTHDTAVFHKQDVLNRCNSDTKVKHDNRKAALHCFLFIFFTLWHFTLFPSAGRQRDLPIQGLSWRRQSVNLKINNGRCTKSKTRSKFETYHFLWQSPIHALTCYGKCPIMERKCFQRSRKEYLRRNYWLTNWNYLWLVPNRTSYVDAERARTKRPGRHGMGVLCAFSTCIAVVDFRWGTRQRVGD